MVGVHNRNSPPGLGTVRPTSVQVYLYSGGAYSGRTASTAPVLESEAWGHKPVPPPLLHLRPMSYGSANQLPLCHHVKDSAPTREQEDPPSLHRRAAAPRCPRRRPRGGRGAGSGPPPPPSPGTGAGGGTPPPRRGRGARGGRTPTDSNPWMGLVGTQIIRGKFNTYNGAREGSVGIDFEKI